MALTCPTCSKRADIGARYCRDCYTVFPSSAGVSAKRPQAETSVIWKILPLVLLAASAAWFIPLDSSPSPAAPDDPFAKAPPVGGARASFAPKAESSANIGASQASGSNEGFGKTGGKLIGGSKCASASDAGTGFCPDVIPSGRFGSAEGRMVRGSQEDAGTAAEIMLPSGSDLSCLPGETCRVVVPFSSGETATYVARGRGSSRVLVPVDSRAAALLKKHGQATVQLRTAGGGVDAVTLRSDGSSAAAL